MKNSNKMKNLSKLILLTTTLIVVSCSSDDSPSPTEITSSAFTASLDENPTASQSLGTISATSDGGDITFAIASQTPSGALTINNATGEISTADLSLYDYEANPQITATISLTTDGVTETVPATINLNDISDIIFTHIVTDSNKSGHVTILDHPDLNNNPDAQIVVSHNYEPNSIDDTNVISLWYNGSNWTIFHENFESMITDTAYNVVISKDGTFIRHSNTGNEWTTTIDDPALNNNPNARPIISNYWNPSRIYNDNNMGILYDASIRKWKIYNESGLAFPTDASFNILVSSDNATEHVHITSSSNIFDYESDINHTSLNSNPNAKFVFTSTSGPKLNKVITMNYAEFTSRWALRVADKSDFTEASSYNILILE